MVEGKTTSHIVRKRWIVSQESNVPEPVWPYPILLTMDMYKVFIIISLAIGRLRDLMGMIKGVFHTFSSRFLLRRGPFCAYETNKQDYIGRI